MSVSPNEQGGDLDLPIIFAKRHSLAKITPRKNR